MYFSYFPQGYYDLTGNGNPKIVTDLMRRVKIRSKIVNEASLYDLYDVQEGDTPESIAFKHFGDSQLHWVILLVNNITDRYYGWPLTQNQFDTYVADKYSNPDAVHHYEITQNSGRQEALGPSDYSHKIEVNSTEPGAQAVSNREYERRIQDEIRQIKLLSPANLSLFIEEFQDLISD